MKIVQEQPAIHRVVTGCVCDRCGVEMLDEPANGAELDSGDAIRIRIDCGDRGAILKADFCPACFSKLEHALGPFRKHLRSVSTGHPELDVRAYRYEMIDAASRKRIRAESIVDDDKLM